MALCLGLLAQDRTLDEEDPFAALQAAEVDRRLRFPDPFRRASPSAHLDGFSLHAGVRIHENDRQGPERLCRYAVRPPWRFRLAPLEPQRSGRSVPRYRVPWAELLRRVFAIDVLECPSCAGRLQVIAFIAEVGVAKRILGHLGMDSQAPPRAPARAPDDAGAFGDFQPDYGSDELVYES